MRPITRPAHDSAPMNSAGCAVRPRHHVVHQRAGEFGQLGPLAPENAPQQHPRGLEQSEDGILGHVVVDGGAVSTPAHEPVLAQQREMLGRPA